MANTQPDFATHLLALLRETFEGPTGPESAYLDRGSGLFTTLDPLTSEAASRRPSGGGPTIAAHCAHLAYYVRVNHNYAVGREQRVDWPSSWQRHQVGDREWAELKDRVQREYRELVETIEGLESWSDEAMGDSLAIAAHTAYHLGAIRHAIKNLSEKGLGVTEAESPAGTNQRKAAAQKAVTTRKRRTAAKRAAATKKRRKFAKKAVATRKRRKVERA